MVRENNGLLEQKIQLDQENARELNQEKNSILQKSIHDSKQFQNEIDELKDIIRCQAEEIKTARNNLERTEEAHSQQKVSTQSILEEVDSLAFFTFVHQKGTCS